MVSRNSDRRFSNRVCRLMACFLAITLAICNRSSVFAQCKLTQTLRSPEVQASPNFGTALALSGDRILIGAHYLAMPGSPHGAAYLMNVKTGDLLHEFRAENPPDGPGDGFGMSVAFSGENVLIGVLNMTRGPDLQFDGAVSLYDGATGKALRTFKSPDKALHESFGAHISVSGDHLLVGAPGDRTDVGRAFLFQVSAGELLRTFTPPEDLKCWVFAYGVALSDDYAAIACMTDRREDSKQASVHVYEAKSGKLLQILGNPDSDANDSSPVVQFGRSISISGDQILVGAGDAGEAIYGDIAHLFDIRSGKQTRALAYPKRPHRGLRIPSVALVGKRALVGNLAGGDEKEFAYIFDTETGAVAETFTTPADQLKEGAGSGVAFDGHRAALSFRGEGAVTVHDCVLPGSR